MPCTPTARQVDRARPLLGTLVSIRIRGHAVTDANRMINAAFDEIAEIHRLMSFHEPRSDVSRLNCAAAKRSVTVDRRTHEVIGRAIDLSRASSGVFDISIGGQLAAWGYLPTGHLPKGEVQGAGPKATWQDIDVMSRRRIRFRKPLWIDLGGIAKGYAVDAALERLVAAGAKQVLVNAGGDLRVFGPEPERIVLRLPQPPTDGLVPAINLQNAAMASSSGRENARRMGRKRVGPHIHGKRRTAVGLETFVSVVAEKCVAADALTKIVLANGARSTAILRAQDATAYVHDARAGWRTLGIGH